METSETFAMFREFGLTEDWAQDARPDDELEGWTLSAICAIWMGWEHHWEDTRHTMPDGDVSEWWTDPDGVPSTPPDYANDAAAAMELLVAMGAGISPPHKDWGWGCYDTGPLDTETYGDEPPLAIARLCTVLVAYGIDRDGNILLEHPGVN